MPPTWSTRRAPWWPVHRRRLRPRPGWASAPPPRGTSRGWEGSERFPSRGCRGPTATAPVGGTPWTLVVAEPSSSVYSVVTGTSTHDTQILLAGYGVLVLVALLGVLRFVDRRDRLRILTERLDVMSRTDPLTGVYNRRQIDAHLRRASDTARPGAHPSRCSCSTSTISSPSTTPTATWPATRCSVPWPPGSGPPSVRRPGGPLGRRGVPGGAGWGRARRRPPTWPSGSVWPWPRPRVPSTTAGRSR